MKMRIIRICPLLMMIILIASLSSSAQMIGTYNVYIPFDFVVGEINHDKGSYRIDLRDPNYNAPVFTLFSKKGKKLEAVVMLKNGNRVSFDESFLAMMVFDRYNNKNLLKQVVSTRFGFTNTESKMMGDIMENSESKPETYFVVIKEKS